MFRGTDRGVETNGGDFSFFFFPRINRTRKFERVDFNIID